MKMLKNSRRLKIAGGLLVREGMGMEREEKEEVREERTEEGTGGIKGELTPLTP